MDALELDEKVGFKWTGDTGRSSKAFWAQRVCIVVWTARWQWRPEMARL